MNTIQPTSAPTDTALIAYIPVLHRGYLQLIERYPLATVWVLSEEMIATFHHLRKDIRSLTPLQIQASLQALIPNPVQLLNMSECENFKTQTIIMPDEDIMHELHERFFKKKQVTFESVFLRWDRLKSLAEVEVVADQTVALAHLEQRFFTQTSKLAQQSSDWWRQVGAVIAKDGQVVLAGFNHHVPDQNQPYINGDPRGNFHKGDHIEISTAFHAEASLIAQAAKQGIKLSGAQMYVSTFPCPNCAKLIAYSGISAVYFHEGYAMVDGESILKDQGVQIIKVAAPY